MHTSQWSRRDWILASALGLGVGIPAGLALGAPLEVLVGGMLVTPLMTGLAGALLGTAQWAVVCRNFAAAGSWVAHTAFGSAIGFTFALVLVEKGGGWLTGSPVRMTTTGTYGLVVALAVLGLVGGGAVGFSQAIFLRKLGEPSANWTGVSAVGVAAGLLVGFGVSSLVTGELGEPLGLAVFFGVAGLVYGAVTGTALPTGDAVTGQQRQQAL